MFRPVKHCGFNDFPDHDPQELEIIKEIATITLNYTTVNSRTEQGKADEMMGANTILTTVQHSS
jgi:hypothetical protein